MARKNSRKNPRTQHLSKKKLRCQKFDQKYPETGKSHPEKSKTPKSIKKKFYNRKFDQAYIPPCSGGHVPMSLPWKEKKFRPKILTKNKKFLGQNPSKEHYSAKISRKKNFRSKILAKKSKKNFFGPRIEVINNFRPKIGQSKFFGQDWWSQMRNWGGGLPHQKGLVSPSHLRDKKKILQGSRLLSSYALFFNIPLSEDRVKNAFDHFII